jgi:Terminase small subunit
MPLRNPVHESMCRDVAGGMSREAAWRAHGFGSRNSTRFFKRPEVAARVAELREEFNQGSAISLAYLQERLLAFTTADVGNYLEKRPYSEKLRVKDLTALPPELRACVSKVTIDRNGTLNFELHDKTKAIEALIKTVAPSKFELTGANGAALFDSDNLAKLNEEEVLLLKRLVAKVLGSAKDTSNGQYPAIEHQSAPEHRSTV